MDPNCIPPLGLDLKLESHGGQDPWQRGGHDPGNRPTFPPICVITQVCREEECHIPEDEPSVEAVGRGSRIMRVAKPGRPQGDRVGIYDPQSCNIKATVWKERAALKVGGNENAVPRDAPGLPDRAPVTAQTYRHSPAPSADHHPLSSLIDDFRSESLSLYFRVHWERSSSDWKLMRPLYSAIWPVSWHLSQTFHIYKFFLFGCSHRRRRRICSRRSCWDCWKVFEGWRQSRDFSDSYLCFNRPLGTGYCSSFMRTYRRACCWLSWRILRWLQHENLEKRLVRLRVWLLEECCSQVGPHTGWR